MRHHPPGDHHVTSIGFILILILSKSGIEILWPPISQFFWFYWIYILEKPVNLLTHWCWSLVDLNDSGMPSRNFNFLLNIPLGRHILVYLEWFNSNWSGRIFCIWCHTITNTPSQIPLHNLKFLIDSINNKMPMKMTFNRVGGSLRSPPFHLNVGYRVTLLGFRDTTNINTLAAKNSTLAKNIIIIESRLKRCFAQKSANLTA